MADCHRLKEDAAIVKRTSQENRINTSCSPQTEALRYRAETVMQICIRQNLHMASEKSTSQKLGCLMSWLAAFPVSCY